MHMRIHVVMHPYHIILSYFMNSIENQFKEIC